MGGTKKNKQIKHSDAVVVRDQERELESEMAEFDRNV